jgi:hypothetical protein
MPLVMNILNYFHSEVRLKEVVHKISMELTLEDILSRSTELRFLISYVQIKERIELIPYKSRTIVSEPNDQPLLRYPYLRQNSHRRLSSPIRL